ncbi:MAG: hypothetical protein RRZ24_02485, partial [Clostridia bacterium]
MAGSKQKKNKNGRSCIRPASIFVIAALFAFNCIVSITSLTPKRYEVFEGGVAKETITAPRMVEDPITTEAMRQSARNGVQTVYSIDIALANTLVSGAKSFFSSLSSFRNTANDIRLQSAPTQTLADGSVVSVDDTRSWQDVIQQNDLLALLLKLPVSLTDTTLGYALLDASESDLKVLEELVMSKLQVKLRAGVTEKDLDRTRTEINKELQITTLPVKSLGEMLFNAYLLPTNVEDTTATTRAKEKAAAEVEPAFISRGATIVEQGQTVTADQMHLLTSLDLVKGGNVNSMFNVGIALYLFCAYALLFFYLRTFECDVFSSTKQMVLLLLIVAITVAVQWLCYIIDPRVMPGIFAVMLVSTLVSKTVAQAINVTLAMTLSLLAGGSGTTLFSSDSLLAMAAMLVTGQAAILMSQKSEKRGALIAAGTVGSIFGGVVIVSGSMILAYTWNS